MDIVKQQHARLGRVRAVASGLLAITAATFITSLLIPKAGIWFNGTIVGGLVGGCALRDLAVRPVTRLVSAGCATTGWLHIFGSSAGNLLMDGAS
jgi:hypothetical protein